jgi:serine/threonine-protein kinase
VLERGTTIADHRVERLIGWGGGGAVYEAVQLSVGRLVALKLLRAELSRDPEFVERFKREARVQASLDHPHVLDVYEAGESPQGLFIAMRLVGGGSLADEIAGERLGGVRALDLLGQIASALDAAHAAGIVHGDVKPQNVLLDADGDAYLADFGLTREMGRTRVTASGAVLGTVAYLAPEVIHGERATAASDRYSLAAMTYECLTGEPPFARGTAAAILYAHTSEAPPRASMARPELPGALDAVIQAGLAKDPAARPPSAKALVERCRAVIGDDLLARLDPPAPSPIPREADERITPRVGPARGRLRTALARIAPRPPAAFAAGLLIAAGAAAVVAVAIDDGESAVGEPAPPAPEGTLPVGSDLSAAADRSVDCEGRRATFASRRCSIAQAELSGAPLRAPATGLITSWAVRGASGEMALQVLRERGGKTFQISLSQFVVVPDERLHRFPANIAIERGDRISLQLGAGASVGIADTGGATTARWFPRPRGFPGEPPQRGPGTGLDGEILVQASLEKGGKIALPKQIQGPEARKLKRGEDVARRELTFREGRKVDVALVEVDRRMYIDLFEQGQRRARIAVEDIAPDGRLVELNAKAYDFEDGSGETGIVYINPGGARVIEHYYGTSPAGFDFYL